MEKIREILEAFSQANVQNIFIPILTALILIFLALLVNYIILYKTQLMSKVLYVHGFIDGEEEYDVCHYHNNDMLNTNYLIKREIPKDKDDWIGKRFLFVTSEKINTMKKNRRRLTIWYNGYSSKGMEYKIKNMPKGWEERKLSKGKIVNYNGTFIISNIMVKTMNLTSLQIDNRDKSQFVLTYLFDNGSKRVQKLLPADFLNDILHKTIPYNFAFLNRCEIIKLR